MKTCAHLWYLAQFFLEWEMFHTKVVEKIKTHILFSITFFRKSCLYEITWKNTAHLDRPQMAIWRTRIGCGITKATDTHSEYVILTAFPMQEWLRERASMLRYTSTACLVLFRCGGVTSAYVGRIKEKPEGTRSVSGRKDAEWIHLV
jgi:hypothetical protein